jgi:hypothetical protein
MPFSGKVRSVTILRIFNLIIFPDDNSKGYLHDYSEQVALFTRNDHEPEDANGYDHYASHQSTPKRHVHREGRRQQGYEPLGEDDE